MTRKEIVVSAGAAQHPDSAPTAGATSFDEVTDPVLAAFADDCTVVETTTGIDLVGWCRRCRHPMTYPYPIQVVGRGILPLRRPPTPREHVLTMVCTCTEEHAGRPPQEYGCGAYWNVTLEDAPG